MSKRRAALAYAVTALLTASVVLSEESPLLEVLAMRLKELRALPPGERTYAVCPDWPERLIGITQARIYGVLGPPDYAVLNEWEYSFRAPLRSSKGVVVIATIGVPQLTFVFSKDLMVEHVKCTYSK